MDHTVIAARVTAAHAKLVSMGFKKAQVQLDFTAWPYVRLSADRPRAMIDTDIGAPHLLFESYDTVEQALDAIDTAIATIPHIWSAADVAATLGLPICESCDEAVATTWLHDDTYVELTGAGPRVCEPCLERAHDRATERAMEG